MINSTAGILNKWKSLWREHCPASAPTSQGTATAPGRGLSYPAQIQGSQASWCMPLSRAPHYSALCRGRGHGRLQSGCLEWWCRAWGSEKPTIERGQKHGQRTRWPSLTFPGSSAALRDTVRAPRGRGNSSVVSTHACTASVPTQYHPSATYTHAEMRLTRVNAKHHLWLGLLCSHRTQKLTSKTQKVDLNLDR